MFTQARSALGAPNTFSRLSDYIYYPMVFSAPLNLALMLTLFWTILRRGQSLSLASDFFSMLNAIYIAGSGWSLFMAFTNFVHQ